MHPILEELTAQLRADTRELEVCWKRPIEWYE